MQKIAFIVIGIFIVLIGLLFFISSLSAQEIDGYVILKGNRAVKYDVSAIIALLDRYDILSIGGETKVDLITEQTFTDLNNPIVKIEGYYVQFEEKQNDLLECHVIPPVQESKANVNSLS